MTSLPKVGLPQWWECDDFYTMICEVLKKDCFLLCVFYVHLLKMTFAIIFSSSLWHFLSDASLTHQPYKVSHYVKHNFYHS